MKTPAAKIILICLTLILTACQPSNKEEVPKPKMPTGEAIGYFCNMFISEHEGPKSQVHLTGNSEPLWFTTVRDGVAYTRLPEESKTVAALYVTAIDSTPTFNLGHPENFQNSWVAADWAVYVIDSRLRGGMGAMEAFPFRDPSMANQFIEIYGGRIVELADIPEEYVLGNSETLPVEPNLQADEMMQGQMEGHDH